MFRVLRVLRGWVTDLGSNREVYPIFDAPCWSKWDRVALYFLVGILISPYWPSANCRHHPEAQTRAGDWPTCKTGLGYFSDVPA
jgi:hypothetical protein